MKVRVDRSLCTRVGNCVAIAPGRLFSFLKWLWGSEDSGPLGRLYPNLKWVWRVVISGAILTLVLGIALEFIKQGSLPVHPKVLAWVMANLLWIVGGFVFLGRLTYFARQQNRFESLARHFAVLKRVRDLKPKEDLSISEFKESYLPRRASDAALSPPKEVQAEELATSLLKEGKPLLILGRPNEGKTRLAYQVLKDFPDYYLLKPLRENLEIKVLDFSALRRQPVVLFLDDLDRFVERFDPESLKQRIETSGCRCCLVATCREGKKELEVVKDKMASLYAHLREVHLLRLGEEEGERLAKEVGVEWQPESFDGTPGSILLGLRKMAQRYEQLEEYQKRVMKALKLLHRAGIFTHRHRLIKGVVESVFGFEEAPRPEWERHLQTLLKQGFLTRSEDPVEAEDAYLENIIADYPHPEEHFPALEALLYDLKDSSGLFYYGYSLLLRKGYEEALKAYEKAVKLKPDYPEAWVGKGFALGGLKRYEEALKADEKAIELKPDLPEAWNNKGFALGKLNRYEEALKADEKAIELKPDYPEAWLGKGVALAKMSRHEEALKAYEKAIELKPDYAKAWNNKGAALGGLKRYEEALKAFEKAIDLKPDDPEAWYNKGFVLEKLNRDEEAMKACEKAIELKPDFPEAWLGKGAALVGLKRYEEALKACEKAIELKPDYPEAWNNRGIALGALKRDEEAVKAYEKAIELKPDFPEAWNSKGAALVGLKRYEEAVKAYEKAIELKPDFPEAWNNKGLALGGLERYEEALEAFERAIELKPEYPEAWVGKGLALEGLGRNKEAKECYKKARELYHKEGREPPSFPKGE